MNLLGLDVGGTNIRVGCFDGASVTMLDPLSTPQNYPDFLRALLRAFDQALASLKGPIERVGVGIPGVVMDGNTMWVPNIPALNGQALAHDLEQIWQARTRLGNDAQMALLGEAWRGAAMGCHSAVLLSMGTGIGGAILYGGKIVRGARQSAGAFGWLTQDPHDPGHPDHGPLERRASGTALGLLASSLTPPLTSAQLIQQARQGDATCLKVLDGVGRALGAAIASLVSVLDPEVLLISGGLSEAFDLLEPALFAAQQRLASPNGRTVPIKVCALKTDAGVYGAIRAAAAERSLFV
jgi:glucokinase